MGASATARALWIWGPLAGYIVLIFYLSSLSSIPWAAGTSDEVLHAVEYFGLALLVARSLNDGLRARVPPRRLVAAFVLSVGLGVADEVWQLFTPHRFSDYRDVISDGIGAALGLLVLYLAQTRIGRARVA